MPKISTHRPPLATRSRAFGRFLGLCLSLFLFPATGLVGAESTKPIEDLGENKFGSRLFQRHLDSSRMVLVPGSEDPDGSELDPFLIDENEITQKRYLRFVDERGHPLPALPRVKQGQNHPVVGVAWTDAAAYCNWVGARLPTELEWQRAGGRLIDGRSYPWGDAWNVGYANSATSDDGFICTAPVGSFEKGASPYGVFDLAGNAEEWVEGNLVSGQHVARGGSWRTTDPELLQLDRRSLLKSDEAGQWVGFRCAADAPP